MSPSFFKKLGPISINQIKKTVECHTQNISDVYSFENFVSIDRISDKSLSFLYDNENLKQELNSSSGLICSENKYNEFTKSQRLIIVKNVQEAVAKISNIFYSEFNTKEKDSFDEPIIGKECEIGKNVIIENGVKIGNNVKIAHGAIIKHNCIIGDGSIIGSNTVIANSILGEHINVGNNTSIGQRGFGFHLKNGKNNDIFHFGKVIIKSFSSIGSGCAIDRGSFSDTVIGENTYIDNLCHIAHNVEIGRDSAFAAMTGIAGSAKIGNNVLTGGQTGIAGHIKIGNDVHIAAKSGVFHSLEDGESVMGNPAIKKFKFLKKYKKIYGNK